MKKLLLTGAGGLVGKRVLEILRKSGKYKIFAATADGKKYSGISGFTPIETDLLKPAARESMMETAKPEILVHLAWDQRAPDFRRSPANYEWLAAGLDIMRLFALGGGRRALYAGSSSEYEAYSGGMAEGGRKREMSPYGECKLALTNSVLPYAEKSGVSLAVARFFTIYGENDAHEFGAIPSAIRSFARREPVTCKAPWAIRDYIYAGDAAAAAVAILESGLRGAVNVASGRPQTMREVFSVVAEEMNCGDMLSFDDENISPDVLTADVSRLTDELGFRCATDLRTGVKKCVEAIRNMGEN